MIGHSSRRAFSLPPPTGIVGKPTIPFQPNRSYQFYPNKSACFFTDLIAGETDYVNNDIAGKADVIVTGNGAFGRYPEGEGFLATLNQEVDGALEDSSSGNTTDSHAHLFEFTVTSNASSFNYFAGWTNGFLVNYSSKHSACAFEGLFFRSGMGTYCLGDIGDGQLHRICYLISNETGTRYYTVAVDGVLLYEDDQIDMLDQINADFRIGLNQYGEGERVFCSGSWSWNSPQLTPPPLTKQAMIDLSIDPWPYLVTLD